MTRRCDRFAGGPLADAVAGPDTAEPGLALVPEAAARSELSAELAAHLETCADCRADRAAYQRIGGALAALGSSGQRRTDHVARVLAAAPAAPAAPPVRPAARWRHRTRRLTAPLLAIAAVAALAWWLGRTPDPDDPRFAIERVAGSGPALRGDAQLGERVRVTARRGDAVWIYRNQRELLRVCPRDCRRDGARVVGDVALDAVGRYQIVWLSTDRVPPPVGDLERDIAAARAAGATHELREIEVP